MSDPGRRRPDGLEPVSVEEFGKLGINAKSELFWDGRRIVTGSRIRLSLPQSILPILAALATLATGVNNASVFLCAREIHWLGCPAPPR